MKKRYYDVSMFQCNESMAGGMSCSSEKILAKRLPLVPTVENVKDMIRKYAENWIADERWCSVKEQIAETMEDCGYFTIELRNVEGDQDFDSYSICFTESYNQSAA